MSPAEIKALVKALSASGVTHFKTPELELSFGAKPQADPLKQDNIPLDAPVSAEDPIKHKVEEMVSLMKLSEQDLVMRLFPDPIDESEQESA